MPTCMVCGSVSFQAHDSLYFCGECGTQSQDFRDEQTEDADVTIFSHRLVLKQKSSQKKQDQEKDENKGKPWLSYEGFQCILKSQVEALIDMGFSPKLKDIVGQIWFRYLSLSNVAFTGSQKTDKINWSACRLTRDVNLVRDKKKLTGLMVMHNKRMKKESKDEVNDEELELSSDLNTASDDQDQENISHLASEETGSEADSIPASSVDDKDSDPKLAKRQTMKLQATIFFCYLGLRWLGEPVGMGDLMRWANTGCLPFHDGVQHLYPHMRVFDRDAVVFDYTKELVLKGNTWDLFTATAMFVGLPAFPEVDYRLFACRFIIDLHLPDCVHRIVTNLMDKYGRLLDMMFNTTRVFSLQCTEERAMSLVIIAMKLLYGLDGKIERELESKVQDIDTNAMPKSSNYIYSWEDWVSFIKQWQSDSMRSGIVREKEDLNYLRDAQNYGSHCLENVFGRWTFPSQRSSQIKRTRAAFMRNKDKDYAKVFQDLVEQSDNRAHNPTAGTFVREPIPSDELQECITRMKSRGIPLFDVDPDGNVRVSDTLETVEKIVHFRVVKKSSNDQTDFDTFPESFRFLITTCAKMISCCPLWLLQVLADIEKRILINKRNYTRS